MRDFFMKGVFRPMFFDNDTGGGGGGGDPLDNAIDSVIAQGELDGGSDASSTSQTSTTNTPAQGTGGQQDNRGGSAPNNPAQQPAKQTQTQGQSAGGATGGANGQQPNTATQGQRPREGSFAPDAQGNIIDHNGNVVARSGSERRLWETKHRLENVVVPQLSQRVQQLTNDLATARAATEIARKHNLSDNESAVAMQLMAGWKKDPLATVKYLLTEVQKAGHDISSLLSGEGAQQTGMGAIARLIDEKLKPFTDAQSQSQQMQQTEAAAAQEAQQFFGTYPDAVIHEAPIAQLLRQFPNMSPDAAYWRLKAYVQSQGLDWNQPLQPQIQARTASENQTQQQQQPNPANPATRPMPNGTNGGGALTQPQTHPVSDANASMADIVRQAMQAEGYNFR